LEKIKTAFRSRKRKVEKLIECERNPNIAISEEQEYRIKISLSITPIKKKNKVIEINFRHFFRALNSD